VSTPQNRDEAFIETCVVDGSDLAEHWDADEYGVSTFFVCTGPAEHSYRSAWTGLEWAPVDQGDYDPA
jgi:hypothetical protein